MLKGIIIGGGVLTIVVVGILYLQRPTGKIIINKDGSGTAYLSGKQANFGPGMGVELSTWNGYTLSASAKSLLFRHGSNVIQSGNITQYDGGSSDIQIVHT